MAACVLPNLSGQATFTKIENGNPERRQIAELVRCKHRITRVMTILISALFPLISFDLAYAGGSHLEGKALNQGTDSKPILCDTEAAQKATILYASQSGQPTLDQDEGGGNPFASSLIELLKRERLTNNDLTTQAHYLNKKED